MLLAYVPSGVKPGTPPPPKFGTLIFESSMDGVEVFINGKPVGTVSKGASLRVPGLIPGNHTIKAIRMGYEPDGPREEMVYPGQESTVSLRIMIPRRRPRAAVERFEEGLEFYNKGTEENYRKAIEQFRLALNEDPNYSQAALFLARVYRDTFQIEEARKQFQRSIDIDADYLEARATYAGMLLDVGDADEAIRQLDYVIQRDKKHALAHYLLAQAFRMKDSYANSIEAARTAIALQPGNAEAHFWLAESLRLSGKHAEAIPAYSEYLRLSDFDSKLAGKMHYYAVGFLVGLGRKKRAAQRDVWQDLRSLAYFGMCDAARMLKKYDAAISACQKALTFDRGDAYTHYVLGMSFAHKANNEGIVEMLPAARKHLGSMLAINPELPEAANARKTIANIDAFFSSR
jgi:tetratricopeptide (TPR) repeat protein